MRSDSAYPLTGFRISEGDSIPLRKQCVLKYLIFGQ